MQNQLIAKPVFQCPFCHALLELNDNQAACIECERIISYKNGIPLLTKDFLSVENTILKAKECNKGDWYESPQSIQFDGPYRHHIKKRRAYLDTVLTSFKKEKQCFLCGLDLGCGDGENLSWLSEYIEDLYGSDYNILRLNRAVQKNIAKRIILADVTDYPVCDESFDIVFFNHVLEHIPDDKKALDEVFRILKPGGLLILGVPNEGAFFWQLAYRLQPEVLAGSDHVHFYTAKTIKMKTEKAGFRIKEVHPIGWGVPHWRLDEKVRNYKIIDDILEVFGKAFFPSQATSLYIIAIK